MQLVFLLFGVVEMKKWYAIKVVSGKDGDVEAALLDMGLESFAPRYKLQERKNGKWREKTKYLLEGYVLLRTEMTSELWYRLRDMWYVQYLLAGAVDDTEVSYIKNYAALADTSEIDYTGDCVTYRGAIACDPSRIIKVDKRKGRALIWLDLDGDSIRRWVPVKIIKST